MDSRTPPRSQLTHDPGRREMPLRMTAVCAAGDHLTAMAAGKETVVRMEAGAEAESPDNGVN